MEAGDRHRRSPGWRRQSARQLDGKDIVGVVELPERPDRREIRRQIHVVIMYLPVKSGMGDEEDSRRIARSTGRLEGWKQTAGHGEATEIIGRKVRLERLGGHHTAPPNETCAVHEI